MRDRMLVIVLAMALAVTLTLTIQDVIRAQDGGEEGYQMCAVRVDDFDDEGESPEVRIYVLDEGTGELYMTVDKPASRSEGKWIRMRLESPRW